MFNQLFLFANLVIVKVGLVVVGVDGDCFHQSPSLNQMMIIL